MYELIINDSIQMVTGVLMDVIVYLNSGKIASICTIQVNGHGMQLDVVRNSYGKYGIQQKGMSAKDLIVRWIDEVDQHYMRRNGVLHQPWQMMPNEWEAFTAIGSAVYNVFPCLTTEQRMEQIAFEKNDEMATGRAEYFLTCELLKRFGFGHNGPEYGNGRDINSRHDVHVAYALAKDKPVPEEIIDWYKTNKEMRFDLSFFKVVLEYPEYRGHLPVKLLSTLCSITRNAIELTSENAGYFISLLSSMPEDSGFHEMDNLLYSRGVLKMEPIPERPAADPATAYNEFALNLGNRLVETRKKDLIEYANEESMKGRRTLREYHRELAVANAQKCESFDYPNKMAKAIEEKNVEYLLEMLDRADDANVTTRKLVEEMYGLKTLRIKASDRRNAIFKFCGYSDIQRAEYERAREDERKAKQKEQELQDIKELAESAKYRVSGESRCLNGAEFVDRYIEQGFNTIKSNKRGNAKEYWLSNEVTGVSVKLLKNDGTLDYARLVRGIPDYQRAA